MLLLYILSLFSLLSVTVNATNERQSKGAEKAEKTRSNIHRRERKYRRRNNHFTKQETMENVSQHSGSDSIAPLDAARVERQTTRDADGLSWLYKAVKANSEAMVKLLPDSGERYDALLWDGCVSLEAAVPEAQKTDTLNLQSNIMRGCELVRKISTQDSADEDNSYGEKFGKNAFTPSRISPEEDTLLYHAVQMRYAPTVQVLLEHKADPEKLTLDGRSLLDIAIANKDDATVKVLRQAIAESYPEGLEGMNQLCLSPGSNGSAEDEEMIS